MSPRYILPDKEGNTAFAQVDDVTLTKGDLNDPKELTADQVKRLEEAGMELEEVQEGQDPALTLRGQALDNALRDAGVEGTSSMSVEEKRTALQEARTQSGTGPEESETETTTEGGQS